MAKNYYLILGIAADASREDIKAAFRRRALELHPDRSGLGSGPFQEVQEAYRVLGDPERRRRYDRTHPPRAPRGFRSGPAPEPLVSQRPKGEPFRPIEPAHRFRDVSLAESFATHRPSFEELFDRLWGNFEPFERPKVEHVESLTVEVVVSPEDARWGGRVRVWIPARATCAACGGEGAVGPYECWQCVGQGVLAREYPLEVDYPAGLRDGDAMRFPLARFGIENLYLTVLFRVSSAAP